ncbi:type II toxin-antitoxin system RelE/ParE family toxin [Flavobacterium sp.]|uniref:type II toxin-antitoxin system RelE/ParE family toxin n=1 Tax=Flavobacterium sp. TaxID=239 RepID=UPI003751769B
MEVKRSLFWTKRALSDLEKIYIFNTHLFGSITSKEIVLKIIEKAEILEEITFDYTKIGEIDKDFNHLKRNYRKLIEGHCKITYRIGNSKIYINRIFDTRQNPNKNK